MARTLAPSPAQALGEFFRVLGAFAGAAAVVSSVWSLSAGGVSSVLTDSASSPRFRQFDGSGISEKRGDAVRVEPVGIGPGADPEQMSAAAMASVPVRPPLHAGWGGVRPDAGARRRCRAGRQPAPRQPPRSSRRALPVVPVDKRLVICDRIGPGRGQALIPAGAGVPKTGSTVGSRACPARKWWLWRWP